MTVVYFIRHSLRDFSVKDDDFGSPLTAEGIERAELLPLLFESLKIDALFSSPYKRCVQTVRPLAVSKKLDIQTISDFREREIGCWIDDFNAYAKEQWADFDYKLENGESLNEVQHRNVQALHLLLEKYPTENLIIGTHGTALATILNYFDKSFNYEAYKRIQALMPYVIMMEFKGLNCLDLKEIELEELY